jgi:Uma2 family endonuclease
MTAMPAPPELALRSHEATWNRARWERLPADGNRYEVIDGYLYMSTAPSLFHQWILGQAVVTLRDQLDAPGIATTWFAPVGVFLPGCDPVQPDIVVVRTADSHVYQEGRIVGVRALLVEVLSPSNASVVCLRQSRGNARREWEGAEQAAVRLVPRRPCRSMAAPPRPSARA